MARGKEQSREFEVRVQYGSLFNNFQWESKIFVKRVHGRIWCFALLLFRFVFGWVLVLVVLFDFDWKTPGFLLSPTQHVGLVNQRQYVLMTVWASSAHGMSTSRDCSRTSMWFTAGDGWDPANFWADCFEKTLWFLFWDRGELPRTIVRKGSQLGATWLQSYSNMMTLKSIYSSQGFKTTFCIVVSLLPLGLLKKEMLKWFCLAVRHAAYGTR